jgi:hypothetical protein
VQSLVPIVAAVLLVSHVAVARPILAQHARPAGLVSTEVPTANSHSHALGRLVRESTQAAGGLGLVKTGPSARAGAIAAHGQHWQTRDHCR